jgi:hypothetical protein
MSRTLIGIVVMALTVPLTATASESREHYAVVTKDMKPAFNVTRVHVATATATTRTFLIADSKGPALRVDILSDYGNRKRVTTFRSFKGSHPVAVVTLDLPFASTTAADRIREIREHPELENAAVPVTVSNGTAQVFRDVEASWHGAAGPGVRAKAAAVVGGELISVLESVKELAGLPMFADLNTTLGYLLPGDGLVRRSMKLLVAKVAQDCTFDATFKMPCHE